MCSASALDVSCVASRSRLCLHPGAAVDAVPFEVGFRSLQNVRLEPVRRLKLEIEQRRQRAEAMFLLRWNEDHHPRADGRDAFGGFNLRLTVDDEVEVFADL